MKNNNAETYFPPQSDQKTIALIQVTRIGDILQTLHAARSVKKFHPNYRLVLICRESFGKPLSFLLNQTFDSIYYLPTKRIYENSQSDGLKNTKEIFDSFLNNLHAQENISVLINLSFSKSSNYLSSSIRSDYKIGTYFNTQNMLQVNDKWSTYLYHVS